MTVRPAHERHALAATTSLRRRFIAATFLAFVPALSSCSRPIGAPTGSSDADAARHAIARAQLANTPAGSRLVALIDAINDGDTAAIVRFGEAHYSPSALAESGGQARLLQRWLEIAETIGPVLIDSAVTSARTTAAAWARGRVSRAWLTIRVTADSTDSNRILSVGLGRGLRPPYWPMRVPALDAESLPAAIRKYVQQVADADLFSGVVMVARQGRTIVQEAHGFADRVAGRKLRPDTPFDVASIGKTLPPRRLDGFRTRAG